MRRPARYESESEEDDGELDSGSEEEDGLSDDDAGDAAMAASLVETATALRGGKSRAPPGGFAEKGTGCPKCINKGCRWCPR